MGSSTVFVYEFFSGGGCPASRPLGRLATEALGLLWALLTDFSRWGAVRTITALDVRFEERVPGLNRKTLPADEVVCTAADGHEETFLSLLERCDALLVLAPETNGILAGLTALAEMKGIPILGSSASAAAAAGHKAACSRLFRRAKLPTPQTCTASFASFPKVAQSMGWPLVIKPIDGVGSEGICRVSCISELPKALAIVRRVTSHDRILLQSFASGIHASVSLLAEKNHFLPLSLNRQLIKTGVPFQYLGSEVPFRHRALENALELACRAASLIPGLRGYVGVDLMLSENNAQLIEINPRLTTSYIGLRQVAQVNLAQAIWQACHDGFLRDRVPLTGQVVIKKDDPGSWGLTTAGNHTMHLRNQN